MSDQLNEAWKELIAEAMRRNVVVAVGKHRAAVEAASLDARPAPGAERLAGRLNRLAETIDSYCDHEDPDPGCLDSIHACADTVRKEAAAIAKAHGEGDDPINAPGDPGIPIGSHEWSNRPPEPWCRKCDGYGEVDNPVKSRPPVICPSCGGTGRAGEGG